MREALVSRGGDFIGEVKKLETKMKKMENNK